jgi:hypothetical protein
LRKIKAREGLRKLKRTPPAAAKNPSPASRRAEGSSMTAKMLLFHDQARERIRCGVDVLANAVGAPLGPHRRRLNLARDHGGRQIVPAATLMAKADAAHHAPCPAQRGRA